MLDNLSGKWKSVLIIIFLLSFFAVELVRYFSLPQEDISEVRETIVIPRGAVLTQIADSLQKHGLLENKKLFIFWAQTLGYDTQMKAGLFRIPVGMTSAQLAAFLTKAKQTDVRLTLIEGWPTEKICARLSHALGLSEKKLDSLANDAAFCDKIGVQAPTLTGYLLPDTYTLPYGMPEAQVLNFLVRRTLAIFEVDSVRHALKESNFSIHQILTLASIVEGEAIVNEERPVIASVYLNRLRRRMPLQADPTIQFIVPGPPRRLLYRDLQIESPYNTYLHYGLPPGPINNPGRASIMAALFPAKTKFLYFVARGDGSHVFAVTAAQHARAKARFNKIRRQVAREKRKKRTQD